MTADHVRTGGLEPKHCPISLGFKKVGMFNSLILLHNASIQALVKYFALSE
ncbi:hypothetical protein [Bifidobacterium sp. M0353]|uniref:hypothetical protein n=1 Tax=Bifidobacterium sp. M0353 TaxID=2751006 RepID=UPI0018DDAB43|nr:hypothetical protein [Bifidobacterium sp. M0353]MBI0150043.1 hypothetical protein [Bifidobacterium sp. M0353]